MTAPMVPPGSSYQTAGVVWVGSTHDGTGWWTFTWDGGFDGTATNPQYLDTVFLAGGAVSLHQVVDGALTQLAAGTKKIKYLIGPATAAAPVTYYIYAEDGISFGAAYTSLGPPVEGSQIDFWATPFPSEPDHGYYGDYKYVWGDNVGYWDPPQDGYLTNPGYPDYQADMQQGANAPTPYAGNWQHPMDGISGVQADIYKWWEPAGANALNIRSMESEWGFSIPNSVLAYDFPRPPQDQWPELAVACQPEAGGATWLGEAKVRIPYKISVYADANTIYGPMYRTGSEWPAALGPTANLDVTHTLRASTYAPDAPAKDYTPGGQVIFTPPAAQGVVMLDVSSICDTQGRFAFKTAITINSASPYPGNPDDNSHRAQGTVAHWGTQVADPGTVGAQWWCRTPRFQFAYELPAMWDPPVVVVPTGQISGTPDFNRRTFWA